MCVLAFAWRASPAWPLVLIGNRDERHDRAAAPLARWEAKASHVLAGVDLAAGGGWLGVSEGGRLAVVTNVRGHGAPAPDAPSRGLLVRHLLEGEGRYARLALDDVGAFNPMNLITVDKGAAIYWSNRPNAQRRDLVAGTFGMSNGGLDDGWPKTDRLKAFLGHWLNAPGANPEELLGALADEQRPDDDLLPATGLPRELERTASAIFIRNETYGTRCSSVVAVPFDGRGVFIERRFDAAGRETGQTRLAFDGTALTR
jgi:uncharacterized protein with NRDE domain